MLFRSQEDDFEISLEVLDDIGELEGAILSLEDDGAHEDGALEDPAPQAIFAPRTLPRARTSST